MKEIGAKLLEARNSIGVSIEEVAEDLKLKPSQIENLEQGNMEAFQDVFYLKYFIKDYAKYLGLKHEELVDQFNEYLFDYTSKISMEDIKRNQGIEEKKETIHSPYTKKMKEKFKISNLLPYVIIFVIIAIIISIVL